MLMSIARQITERRQLAQAAAMEREAAEIDATLNDLRYVVGSGDLLVCGRNVRFLRRLNWLLKIILTVAEGK